MNVQFPVASATLGAVVWTVSPRSLTNFGTAVLLVENANQTLAASGTFLIFSLTVSPGMCSVGVKAGSGAFSTIALFDGANEFPVLTVAANSIGAAGNILISDGIQCLIRNTDAAHAATYAFAQMTFAV